MDILILCSYSFKAGSVVHRSLALSTTPFTIPNTHLDLHWADWIVHVCVWSVCVLVLCTIDLNLLLIPSNFTSKNVRALCFPISTVNCMVGLRLRN